MQNITCTSPNKSQPDIFRPLLTDFIDTDKVNSLHKTFTSYIAKSGVNKDYEFRNKVGLLTHSTRRVILAIKFIEDNPHNTNYRALFERIQSNQRSLTGEIIYDRADVASKKYWV